MIFYFTRTQIIDCPLENCTMLYALASLNLAAQTVFAKLNQAVPYIFGESEEAARRFDIMEQNCIRELLNIILRRTQTSLHFLCVFQMR